MSERKKMEVYAAISNSIMDLRIELKKNNTPIDPLAIDGKLFKLEIAVWKRLKNALDIEGI